MAIQILHLHCIYSSHTRHNKQAMQSYLGMNQTTTSLKKDGSLRKRPAAQSAPKRSGDIWESVEILIDNENDTAPRVKCVYCETPGRCVKCLSRVKCDVFMDLGPFLNTNTMPFQTSS